MIILDTHAWIWWASTPNRLSKKAARAIQSAKQLGVPAICLWELATLVEKGRLQVDRSLPEWMNAALSLPKIELIALTPAVAVRSSQLGADFHGDPADRLVVATALVETAPLVTKDARIHDYDSVKSVW